ncbi:MAG: four helix bundle protein [Planctomycetota bacterium]|nr:four helix bundle protein [Planctomycetaceae bacterium]MDQ3330002.1 four helix bundle protein [Planctomycetota bacterium]
MAISDYRGLIVWQKAMDLVMGCHRLSQAFPDDESFGLTSQLRRAAVSIPANIAEVAGRGTRKAFTNHLWIANGSLRELETHVLIAQRLNDVAKEAVDETLSRTAEIGRLLVGLRRSLQRAKPASPSDES